MIRTILAKYQPDNCAERSVRKHYITYTVHAARTMNIAETVCLFSRAVIKFIYKLVSLILWKLKQLGRENEKEKRKTKEK